MSIIILTALALEQDAVISKLIDIDVYEHPLSRTQYKVGYYLNNGKRLKIIVGRTNQTNVNAGIETERIIQHFKPSHIFFIGVAGGIKDVKVGDIVIGADVIGYERGKAEDTFQSRVKFGFSSYELEMKAVDYSYSELWKSKAELIANKKFGEEISVISGTIASGEKVIASTKSLLYLFIKSNFGHALAVEMEGLGFLEACRPYPLIKTLLLRGISDLLDDKEVSDKEGSQPYASNNVSEFLFGLIGYLKLETITTYKNETEKLLEVATKLYPEGVKDKGIWQRAGGDLSLIQLYSTGKAQWVEALRLVQYGGGGGDIDFESLLNEMKKDYPKIDFLQSS